jgi:hypothetical protein
MCIIECHTSTKIREQEPGAIMGEIKIKIENLKMKQINI